VVDWHLTPDSADSAEFLLNSVSRDFNHAGISRVSCWARGQSRLHPFLAQAGLSPTGRETNFCYIDLENRHEATLTNSTAWQVEMADSDVY
jgi:hypothetical protein